MERGMGQWLKGGEGSAGLPYRGGGENGESERALFLSGG